MSFEHSGTVEFPVDGVPRAFSFKASVADDKLQLWLEDSVTKEQWQTKQLKVADFVTLDTAIPMAKAPDYALRIVECLAPSNGASDKPTRSLSRAASDGSRVLMVGFSLQVMAFVTAIEYAFTLAALDLNPTDLLTSRMRDLELSVMMLKDENLTLKTTVDDLTTKLTTLQAKPTSGLICAQFTLSTDKTRGDTLLTWTPSAGFPLDGLTLNEKTASVKLNVNGVYSVNLEIPRYLKLLVNGKSVQFNGVANSAQLLLILGAGDALSMEREAIYSTATGRISIVLTRELATEAVQCAKAAAAELEKNGGNQADEPVFDAFATTGDY